MVYLTIDHARTVGHKTIYIMSGEQGMYEKYGFEKVGDFKTIYGSVDQLFQKHLRLQQYYDGKYKMNDGKLEACT